MTAIFFWQLRDNLRSLRFGVSLAVLALFFVANGVVYGHKMARQADETVSLRESDEARFEVDGVADATDHWYRIELPPLGTEYIAEAGFSWAYTGMWINPRSGETVAPTSTRTTNNWMARFEVVDWTVISRYVVTFLCIVLAYNGVSGERESGTLRLVLTNPVSRAGFLLGKLLAHWLTVVGTATVGAVLSLLLLAAAGVLRLDAAVAGAAGAWLLCVAWLCALFLLLGLGISALSRSSATALMFLVTAWTVIIVVVPQTSYLIAVRAVEPLGPYWEAMGDHRAQTERALRLEGVQPRPAAVAAGDGFALEREYARRLGELEAELDAMRRDLNERIFRQVEVARAVNLISPGYACQYAIEAVLGAGVVRLRAFFDDGWRYREALRQFLRAADADDPDSPHVPFLADYVSRRPVDSARFPRYQARPVTTAEAVAAGTVPLSILVLETALAFLFALWAVRRADLAGG